MINKVSLAVVITMSISLFACGTSIAENKQSENTQESKASDLVSFGEVVGTIFDETGNPIAEAGIAVTKGTAPFPEILMVSSEKGDYVWRLPPGKFTLTVNQDGYKPTSREVEVKSGETVRLDFKLKKIGQSNNF